MDAGVFMLGIAMKRPVLPAAVLLAAAWVAPVHAAADCAGPGGTPLVRLESTSPLLAEQADATLVVEVHEDGCLRVHRPAHFRAAGTFVARLAAPRLESVKATVSPLQRFDAAALRQHLRSQAKKGDVQPVFHVSDEPLITLRLGGKAARSIDWASLQADRLNHPEVDEVKELAAAVDALLDLTRMPTLIREEDVQ